MKTITFLKLTGLGLILTVPAIGCKSTNYGVTKLPEPSTPHIAQTGSGDVSSSIPIDSAATSTGLPTTPLSDPSLRQGWARDAEMFKGDTVHFDYDSSLIKSADKSKVLAVAEYLKANAQDALEIDGHADERGTEEYNRALGDRRAAAIREELGRLGIDLSRVDITSFGKDRPVDAGHTESAHRKNRRGEFLLEVRPK